MKKISRRGVLSGVAMAGAVGGIYMLYPKTVVADDDLLISPLEALDLLQSNKLLLIDIRRPDEWARTGIAKGAVPIDLRNPDFLKLAVQHQNASGGLPLAVICARGVRSRRTAAAMTAASLGPITDIPEGMLGSSAGPGWIARGLPIQSWAS